MPTHEHAAGLDVGHVLLHALTDTAKMLPFLFLAYLAIEYIEQRKSGKLESLLAKGGRYGFVAGALLGLVPQCGFSAMAANLYASRVITLGTLLAVFIATSDEAIPVMLAQPGSWPYMALLIACKLGWALIVGFLVDVVCKNHMPASLRGGFSGHTEDVDCHHHEGENILLAAARHTANIFLVVFGFTFAFGLLVEWLGEHAISGFLAGLGPAQPLVAALFGLIPNCASSVLLTQLFLGGSISFGSVFAGLSANAGIGITVLLRANRNIKQNLFVLGLLVVLGTLPGLVFHLLGV